MRNDEIHVVGAGLAGLAAAATIARAGQPVVVHETRSRLGGRATTDERDGHRFNQGPHALYRGGPGAAVLAHLGIDVAGAVPDVGGLLLRADGEHRLPVGPGSLVRTTAFGLAEKVELARLLTRIPRTDPVPLAGVSVAHWLDDIATRPRVRALVEALVRLATYVDQPGTLSAEVAVTQLRMATADGVVYPDGGWERLVDVLAATLGIEIVPGDPVTDLPDAAAVIVAVGSPAATVGLVGALPGVAGLGPAAEVASLDLGLRRRPPVSFALGVDVPTYLSRHSIAAGLAPAGQDNVAVAQYLGPDATPDRVLLEATARRAGIVDDDVVVDRYLHRMVAVTATPCAAGGGLAGRPGITVPDRPGTFVAGDWVGADGHLADASLASGHAAALAALAHVASRPVPG